jgi:transposase
MGGKSPIVASDEQRVALTALAGSRDRGEADRARSVLLTLSGWSSPQIAAAFGVREDRVRQWRSAFWPGGLDALKASIAPGPPPVKSETALRVVTSLLEEPVADRPNWTIARLRAEIEARERVRISRSCWSRTMGRSTSASSRSRPARRARTGSPSSGCQNTPQSSTTSKSSATTSRRITFHQTFTDVAALNQAIHTAVHDINHERMPVPLAKLRISA